MTQTHAKGQGQRSVGFKDRVEADGWTDGQTVGKWITISNTVELHKIISN